MARLSSWSAKYQLIWKWWKKAKKEIRRNAATNPTLSTICNCGIFSPMSQIPSISYLLLVCHTFQYYPNLHFFLIFLAQRKRFGHTEGILPSLLPLLYWILALCLWRKRKYMTIIISIWKEVSIRCSGVMLASLCNFFFVGCYLNGLLLYMLRVIIFVLLYFNVVVFKNSLSFFKAYLVFHFI